MTHRENPLPYPQAVATPARGFHNVSTGACGDEPSPCLQGDSGSGMDRIDGCPNCVTNTEAPYEVHPLEGGVCCHYECADCLHVWHTQYRTEEN